jgi:hypothetical protein
MHGLTSQLRPAAQVVTACDPSFLFSLYGSDSQSPKAGAWAAQNTRPLSCQVSKESVGVSYANESDR